MQVNHDRAEVVIITKNNELRLNAVNGDRISAHPHKIQTDEHQFMQIRTSDNTHTVIAVPKGTHQEVQTIQQSGKVVRALSKEQPLFYTQVTDHAISGYQIDSESNQANRRWTLNLGGAEKIIDISVQYSTLSQATDPQFILPTSFGVDGVLLYKFLDSNTFSITTQSTEDLSTYTVMLVNGVTGSVLYQ